MMTGSQRERSEGKRRAVRPVLAAAAVLMFSGWVVAKPPPHKTAPTATGERVQTNTPTMAVAPDLSGPQPKLVVTPGLDYDFGDIWAGPSLQATFTIKNEGDATLEIIRVKPSCGCTIAGTYPPKIEPGESGEFPFALNSVRLSGKFRKSITITTNDPANRDLRLNLEGTAKQHVDVLPGNAVFGKVSADDSHERVIKIVSNIETPLKIKLDETSKPPFTFELKEVAEGKEFELRVKMTPPFPPGTQYAKVNLETNIEERKSIPVVANATVPDRLDISPPQIVVSPIDGVPTDNNTRLRPVRLTNYGKTPVHILEGVSDDPDLKVQVNEQTPGKAYIINVEMPANYNPPDGGRMITLKTDDTERPLIQIPVQGRTIRKAEKTPKLEDGQLGETTPPAPKSPEGLVGMPAPGFTLDTVGGKPLNSADFGKHPATVLNFVAANCGFCKKQAPRIEPIRKEYESKGVRFVNVVQTMGKPYETDQVVSIFKEAGSNFEIAHDRNNTVGQQYNANGYPTMVVIGKSGKVEAVNIGNITDLESKMRTQLDALVAGKPVPAEVAAKPNEPAPPTPAPQDQPKLRPVEQLVGQPAPAFTLQTVDGQTLSSGDFGKHPATVLNFVAANCGFCKKQAPRLEPIRQEYEAKGVRFFNVVETMRQKYETAQVVDIFKQAGSNITIAHDADNVVGGSYSASGFPTMVVVGKSGKIEAVNVGNIGDLETRLKGQLDALLAGKPVPTAAAPTPAPTPAPPAGNFGIGKPAPAFALTTVDGKPLGNETFKNNKATVLNFVAPNCGFCKKQSPRIETLRPEFEAKGVRFVNVIQTMRQKFETPDAVKAFTEAGSKAEMAHDPDNKVGPLYNASGFPTMVIVGQSGNVEAINVGNIPDLESKMKGQLDALVAGQPVPAELAGAAPAKPSQPQKRPAEELVGQPAPQFDIATVEGKKVNNASLSAHPATVLNFVAPNCGFCKKQLPNVEKVRQEYEAKGVRFVNVVQTMRQPFTTDEAKQVFDATGAKLEFAHDQPNAVGGAFKAGSFPTMVVVDRNGVIKFVNVGAKPDIEQMLKGQLDGLLKGS